MTGLTGVLGNNFEGCEGWEGGEGGDRILGMLANQDHADIFQGLLQKRDRVYLVPIPDSNYAAPEDLALLAKEICPELSHCQAYPDLISGLDAAIGCQNSLTILGGSLYLLGYFRQI